ncbi:hypothetical protein LDENG_00231990, partial [Lucifuga dentata]
AESSSSRMSESEISTPTQAEAATPEQQVDAESLQPEQVPPAAAVEELQPPSAPPAAHSLSPRQRRAQQRSQQGHRDAASRPAFPAAPPEEESHAGSAVLILVLTLALAALIFRRFYLAHEYKFDYEL